MSKGKKQFVKVGAMLQKKELDKQGRAAYYLKVDENTDLRINGVKVTAVNIERPTDKFERMVAAGKMTEEEFEQAVADFDKDGKKSFVKFEFQATLES